MIKANANDGVIELEMEGDMASISADVCAIIKSVYNCVFEQDPVTAVIFREFLIQTITDEKSPVFKYNYNKEEQ